ncbi:MAG TPA: hypothetical protein VM734_24720 [Kofleriaceae bacterium]|jgi:hypothetical protein|nr:hypothetical protein [Kofleriaceae bacterium]
MQRADLEDLRHRLVRLHKTLIDVAREDLERIHGRLTPHELLHMLTTEAELAWLRPLSAVIVRMDEWLDAAEPPAGEDDAAIAELRRLLTPDPDGDDFQRRYVVLLQRSPDVVIAHAATTRAL